MLNLVTSTPHPSKPEDVKNARWGLQHLSKWLNKNLYALTEEILIDHFYMDRLEGALIQYPTLTYVS